MSEQIRHNPEQELPQWSDTCSRCEQEYPLTPQNTLYVYFEKQEECSYLVCKCTHCGSNTMIFDESISPNDALARDIMVDDADRHAPDEIYKSWLQVKGIELPQSYEITDRHEKLVTKFGENMNALLDNAPDIFWGEMNEPNSFRPYPQRWT